MKALVGLLVFGAVLVALQGAVASWLPGHWAPDLGLLGIVALGLASRSITLALLSACCLGYFTDALSGSLLGQHALLRTLELLVVLLAGRQLSLRGGLPLAVFAACLTVGDALAISGLTIFMSPTASLGLGVLWPLFPQLFVNALAAPLVVDLADRLAALLSDDEAKRLLHFDTRSFPA